MSNKALNWARKVPLKRGEKSLLMALANSFNEAKGCCYPKSVKLAEWCGCSERSINRYVKSLVSKNIVQKEDIRNHYGHRIGTKYYLNFDLNLDSLTDNLSGRKIKSLTDNLSIPNRQFVQPNRQTDGKDYIINQNNKPKEKQDFSLVDKNEQAILEILIGVKFEELRKVNDDSCDLRNAQKLFKEICLKKMMPIQFAESLIVTRKQQKLDYDKIIKGGGFTGALCSLTNWLRGERWTDIIKPIGIKKKVSLYVKCKGCGEEHLKGSYCNVCAERQKPRTMRMTAYA